MSQWLVIANESRARILQKSSARLGNFFHVVDLVRSGRRSRTNAAAGRVESSGHGIEGPILADLADACNDADFARDVACQLDRGIASERCVELVLVAAQPLLGRLWQQLSAASRKAIRFCHPHDLTHLRDAQIAERLQEIDDENQEVAFQPTQAAVHRPSHVSSRYGARMDSTDCG